MVRRPTSAQVMISRFVGWSPASGSVLTAWSLEPVPDSVSLSLCPAPAHTLSLSLSKIKNTKKKFKKSIWPYSPAGASYKTKLAITGFVILCRIPLPILTGGLHFLRLYPVRSYNSGRRKSHKMDVGIVGNHTHTHTHTHTHAHKLGNIKQTIC